MGGGIERHSVPLDNNAGRPMPAYFQLPPTMTVSWAATSMTITCTGKNHYQFLGCTKTGGAGVLPVPSGATVTAVVPTLDNPANTVSVLTMPPYFALCYVQRVA